MLVNLLIKLMTHMQHQGHGFFSQFYRLIAGQPLAVYIYTDVRLSVMSDSRPPGMAVNLHELLCSSCYK